MGIITVIDAGLARYFPAASPSPTMRDLVTMVLVPFHFVMEKLAWIFLAVLFPAAIAITTTSTAAATTTATTTATITIAAPTTRPTILQAEPSPDDDWELIELRSFLRGEHDENLFAQQEEEPRRFQPRVLMFPTGLELSEDERRERDRHRFLHVLKLEANLSRKLRRSAERRREARRKSGLDPIADDEVWIW